MRVVSVANQKGGCGKTTVAVNLASALANLGARVLLVDNDPQGHATLGMGLRGSDFTLSTRDLYLTSDIRVEEVCHTVKDQLDLVPCDVDLSTVDQALAHESHRVERLVAAFAQSQMPYDIVVLDNPPNVGLLTFNALMASSEALVPVDPGRFTLEAVDRFRETLDLLEVERGHRVRMHLLPNGFDVRTRFGRDLLERMAMSYPNALLDTQIHRTVRLREAADVGQPVDVHDRGCRAVLDFQAIAEELWTLSADVEPARFALAELEAWDTMLHGPRTGPQGVRFEGKDGWVHVTRSGLSAEPQKILRSRLGPGDLRLPVPAGDDRQGHRRDFLDCVKQRGEPIAPVEVGHRSATVCHLGNIAMHLGRPLRWDPKNEIFPEDEVANRYLSSPMREPYGEELS